jgi:hypothetical protein
MVAPTPGARSAPPGSRGARPGAPRQPVPPGAAARRPQRSRWVSASLYRSALLVGQRKSSQRGPERSSPSGIGWAVLTPPVRGHHGQAVQGLAHRLTGTFQAIEGADSREHGRGIGALPPAGLHECALSTAFQQRLAPSTFHTARQQARPELTPDGGVAAGVGQLQAEHVLPVAAAAHRRGGRAVAEPCGKWQECHQRQTPRRLSRSAARGAQRGEGRVLVQAAKAVLHPELHVAPRQRGVGHPGRLGGNGARIVGILRGERQGRLLAQQVEGVNDRDPSCEPRVPPLQHCSCRLPHFSAEFLHPSHSPAVSKVPKRHDWLRFWKAHTTGSAHRRSHASLRQLPG